MEEEKNVIEDESIEVVNDDTKDTEVDSTNEVNEEIEETSRKTKKKKGKKAKFHKIIFLDSIIKLGYGAYLIFALSKYGFGAFWLVAGLLLLYLAIHWRKKRILPFLLTVLIVLNFASSLAILACGANKDTSKADVVVIPGYKLEEDKLSLTLKNRLDKASEYYRSNNYTYFIVMGPLTKGNTLSQGNVMKTYLMAQGVPEELIIVEEEGSNVAIAIDNIHSYMAKTDKVTVISSLWQLVRIKELLRGYGIYAKGLAADSPIELIPNELLLEKLGIIYAIIKVR